MKRNILALFMVFLQVYPMNLCIPPTYKIQTITQTLANPSIMESPIFRIFESFSSLLPRQIPSPPFEEYEVAGVFRPIWFEMQTTVSALLNQFIKDGKIVEVDIQTLFAAVKKRLSASRIEINEQYFRKVVIDRLTNAGIINNKRGNCSLKINPLAAAVWADDAVFLKTLFADMIATLDEQNSSNIWLDIILAKCAEITAEQELYPIEARYPVLRAIALLDKDQQQKLKRYIHDLRARNRKMYTDPLINSISLMLDVKDGDATWIQDQTPRLKGVRVYEVTAEGQNVKGGLGRVEQYHTLGMKQLGAEVAFVEPFYRYKRDVKGERIPCDYLDQTGSESSIAVPVQNVELYTSFSMFFKGESIQVDVYKGINARGVEVFLIRDHEDKYVKTLYEYGSGDNPSMLDFTEFFTKASWEFIKREETSRRQDQPELPPSLINLNDGQTLPLAVWKSLDRAKHPSDSCLAKIFVSGTTHTYKNRGYVGSYAKEKDRAMLDTIGVPREYQYWFHNTERTKEDPYDIDISGAGIGASDFAKAVAGIHAKEVQHFNPEAKLYGITNGDDLVASTTKFRSVMERQGIGKDYFDYDLTEEELIKIKRAAKSDLGLEPDKMVISYSGRLVDEKSGEKRAFTEDNIMELVKRGIQLVIYGNVQPYKSSQKIVERYAALAERIRKLKEEHPLEYPGTFIFKPVFTLQEQIELLAATDVQAQDSDRRTGACEYTEADVSANGGLQLSPPFWEGLIAKQWQVIDFEQL